MKCFPPRKNDVKEGRISWKARPGESERELLRRESLYRLSQGYNTKDCKEIYGLSSINDLSDKSRASSILSKNGDINEEYELSKSDVPNRVRYLRDWVKVINRFATEEVSTYLY